MSLKIFLSVFLLCSLTLVTVLPIVLVTSSSGNALLQQERCDCENPTINFTANSFDIGMLAGGLSCGNPVVLFPSGNLAIYFYDNIDSYFLKIYSTNGNLISSTLIDATGSGQWSFGFCDPDVQSMVAIGNFIYIVHANQGPTRLGLMRYFHNGTLDTSIGLNGYFLFGPGLNGAAFTYLGAVTSSSDALFIGGYTQNDTQGFGYIRKYFVPSLTLDVSFGDNGDAYFPQQSTCGDLHEYVDPYGSMLYDPSSSRILFAPRFAIFAVDAQTGVLDTSFGSGNGCFGVPLLRGTFGSILLSTGESIWGSRTTNSATGARVFKVSADGTSFSSSTPISAGRNVRKRVAPFCSRNFVEMEIKIENPDPPFDLKVIIRDLNTLNNFTETQPIQVSFVPNSLIYVESLHAFFIFNTDEGAALGFPVLQAQCEP